MISGFGAGMGFVLHFMLAFLLGVEDYSRYSFIISLSTIISFLATYGFPFLANRLAASYSDDRNWAACRGLAVYSLGFSLVFGVTVGGGVYVLVHYFGNLDGYSPLLFLLGAMMVPTMAWARIVSGFFRGLERPAWAVTYENVGRDSLFVLILGIASFMVWDNLDGGNSTSALGLMLICFVMMLIPALGHLVRIMIRKNRGTSFEFHVRDWMQVAWPLLLVLAMQMLIHRLDIVMLGFMTDPQETGSYALSAKVAQAATLVNIAVFSLFGARAAILYKNGESQSLGRFYRKMGRILLAGVSISAIVVYFALPYLLGILGQGYEGSLIPAYLLLLGHILNAGWGPAALLLTMSQYEKPLMHMTFVALGVNIVLNLILIPVYGGVGAALATIISLNLRNGVAWFYARLQKVMG